jgi:Ca-activated chloride channel family protein
MNREHAETLLAQLLTDELDEQTRQELTAYLQTDDALRDQLADMRLTAQLIRQAHAMEDRPTLSAERRVALLEAVGQTQAQPKWWTREGPLYRFGQLARVAAVIVLSAGLIALMVGVLLPELDHSDPARPHAVAVDKNLPDDAPTEFADDFDDMKEADLAFDADTPPVLVASRSIAGQTLVSGMHWYENEAYESAPGTRALGREAGKAGRRDGDELKDQYKHDNAKLVSGKLGERSELDESNGTAVRGGAKTGGDTQSVVDAVQGKMPAGGPRVAVGRERTQGKVQAPQIELDIEATPAEPKPAPSQADAPRVVAKPQADPFDPQGAAGTLASNVTNSKLPGPGAATPGTNVQTIENADGVEVAHVQTGTVTDPPPANAPTDRRTQAKQAQQPINDQRAERARDFDDYATQQRATIDARANQVDDLHRANVAASFRQFPVNGWVETERDRRSNFALDTDNASYTLTRRYIRAGYRPPTSAVRTEEFVNNFKFTSQIASEEQQPALTIHAEAAPSPFAKAGSNSVLLKLGIKGQAVKREDRKPAHVIVVTHASDSAGKSNSLPMMQYGLKQLAGQLREDDRITVIDAGDDNSVLLKATKAKQRESIRKTIDTIKPGKDANLTEGLALANQLANDQPQDKQINRVVLVSNGSADFGQTDAQDINGRIDNTNGVPLTTVGFGVVGLNDALMEQLANTNGGEYFFIDSARAARQAFARQIPQTLPIIARNAKVQVEFDPAVVHRHRLIGYENRVVLRQDANGNINRAATNISAIGAGQSVTALYELQLNAAADHVDAASLGTVRVRYREARTDKRQEIAHQLPAAQRQRLELADRPRFYLAACAATFAEILRGSPHAADIDYEQLKKTISQVAKALPLDQQVAELRDLIHAAQDKPVAP